MSQKERGADIQKSIGDSKLGKPIKMLYSFEYERELKIFTCELIAVIYMGKDVLK